MNLEETRQRIKFLRKLAETKYAWPGGYEILFHMEDGGCLCCDCVLDKSNSVHVAHPKHSRFYCADGWGVTSYYTMADCDESEWCSHCNKEIT